jgi:hypothetical protein
VNSTLVAREDLLHLVALVEEPGPLRQEVAQPVQALRDHAADEPGLEVVGQDRLHHVLGREVALQQREVAAKDCEDAAIGERKTATSRH